LVLKQGTSVEGVRGWLGEPLATRTLGDEPAVEMLFYGRWQLLFEDGKLANRVKYVNEHPIRVGASTERRERALAQRVLGLRRGVSRATIRSRFGVPKTIEITGDDPREETLSYGAWHLIFVGGALRWRNRR
jgi:hypothetical protein